MTCALKRIMLLLIFSSVIHWNESGFTQDVVAERSNIAKLRQIAQRYRTQYKFMSQRARQAASLKGWIIRKKFSDGRVIEIQGLDAKGIPLYYATHNVNAAKTLSTDKVCPGGLYGLHLTGIGMTIGEWDAGAVRATHQEFGGRVTQADGAIDLDDHSTHVAGTLIAAGVNSQAKGMAFQSRLNAYNWDDDNSEMSSAAADGLLLSNHSYGYIRGWDYKDGDWYWYGDPDISETEDYKFGFYDDNSREWDEIAYNAPYYLIVIAGGNERNDAGPSPGGGHYVNDGVDWVWSTVTRNPDGGSLGYDCLDQLTVAKNILTVGAVNDILSGYIQPSNVVMTNFSSWGPTDDGRIKPDIVGNGSNLYSPVSNSDGSYGGMSGTSMASPNIAGSLLLLQEHYMNLHGGIPMLAATLKALVIHTADESGPADGPDYMYGWGLMNTARAADVVSNDGTDASIMETALIEGESFNIDVPASGDEPLLATLCWTDPAGTPIGDALNNRTKMLVNDLDLRISNTGGIAYFPWFLDPDNPSGNVARGDNSIDNVEQVSIANPSAGETYTISVTHKSSLQDGLQNFSLIVSGMSNADTLNTSPVAFFTVLPDSGTTSTIFNFDARGSIDLEDNISLLKVRWDWEDDEIWDTEWDTLKTATHQYNDTGTYTVKLEVKDTADLIDDTKGTVAVVDSVSSPLVHIEIPLHQGWTWFSINVTDADMTLNNVLSNLTPLDGDLIKNQTGFSTYYNGTGWWGDLSELLSSEMYMIKLSSINTIRFSGKESKLADIPLNDGWTWIGYMPQTLMHIDEALQSLSPTDGDLIKNQAGFSMFYTGIGWWGNLDAEGMMRPFNGYKIKMAFSDTLSYPDSASAGASTGKMALADNSSANETFGIIPSNWSVIPSDYVNTMTMTAQISINGKIVNGTGCIVGVFVDGKCLGIGKPAYFPLNDSYVIPLTIYSNAEEGKKITFKAITTKGIIINIKNACVSCAFRADSVIGNALAPFILSGTTAAAYTEENSGMPKTFTLYNNYPNPFNPETVIKFQMPQAAFVELKIYNTVGQLIKTLLHEELPAGVHRIRWDGTNASGQQVSSGVYLYQIRAGNFSAIKKMMFLK